MEKTFERGNEGPGLTYAALSFSFACFSLIFVISSTSLALAFPLFAFEDDFTEGSGVEPGSSRLGLDVGAGCGFVTKSGRGVLVDALVAGVASSTAERWLVESG